MKRFGKIVVCFAGGLALSAGLRAASPASAKNPAVHPAPANVPVSASIPVSVEVPVSANNIAASENPYIAIATRNVFGLNPPAPPTPPEDPAKDLPKITPTGIMGVFGHWQVLFKVAPAGAKPGPAAKEEYYTLSEGQRQDDIEVVKIDEKNSMVTFDNHGFPQELPLAEPSASGGAAPSPAGGMNTAMAAGPFGGGGSRGAGGFTPPFGGGFGGNNGGGPNGNPGLNGGNPNGPNGTIGGMNFGGTTQAHVYQPPASQFSPDETAAIVVLEKEKYKQEGNPIYKIMPPVPGMPDDTDNTGGPPMPH